MSIENQLPKGVLVIPKIKVTEEQIRQAVNKINKGLSSSDVKRLNRAIFEEQKQ